MKKPTEKLKEIEESIILFSLEIEYSMNLSMDSFIEKLQEFKEKEFDKLNFFICGDSDYGYRLDLQAVKKREETDEEFQNRLNQWQNLQLKEKQKKKENLEREKQEYERLKKKFEK